jgi:lipid-binding SYLF domain-containing protein
MKRMLTLACLASLLLIDAASADWSADTGDELQQDAARSIASFRDRMPRTESFFEQAWGYAVFPSVTRVGVGFGGAYGKGIVIEGDRAIGTSKYKQFTSGIQIGARKFSMIVFFKDEAALRYYQTGKTRFMGQAGLAIAKFGIAGTPAYNDGVAVVTLTRFGLMAEFTVSGARFTYTPIVAASPER